MDVLTRFYNLIFSSWPFISKVWPMLLIFSRRFQNAPIGNNTQKMFENEKIYTTNRNHPTSRYLNNVVAQLCASGRGNRQYGWRLLWCNKAIPLTSTANRTTPTYDLAGASPHLASPPVASSNSFSFALLIIKLTWLRLTRLCIPKNGRNFT